MRTREALYATPSPASASQIVGFLSAGILLVMALHLIQVFTPIRLSGDSLAYLGMTSSAVDGHGFLVDGEKVQWPIGYSVLLFCLEQIGLGDTIAFVSINCGFAGLGVWASYRLYRSSFQMCKAEALLLCLIIMLSWLLVKYIPMILSEATYFGLSVLALLLLYQAERQVGWRCVVQLILAVVLATAATIVRTQGVVLYCAVAWVLWVVLVKRSAGLDKIFQKLWLRTLVILALCGCLTSASIYIIQSKYFVKFLNAYKSTGVLGGIPALLYEQLGSLGHIALNLPSGVMNGSPLYVIGALLTLPFLVGGVWVKRATWGPVEVFTVTNAVFLLAVPWKESRFWMTSLPFFLAYVYWGMRYLLPVKAYRLATAAWLAGWTLTGVAALSYSTYLSFAGSRFPALYGRGTVRGVYEAAYSAQDRVDENWDRTSKRMFECIRRYDRRSNRFALSPTFHE